MILAFFDHTLVMPVVQTGIFSGEVQARSFNLRMWKTKKLRLDRDKRILYAER